MGKSRPRETDTSDKALADRAVCTYCKKPCDGSKHDIYGEHVLRRTDLIVCDVCDEDFQNEPGPWSEWN